MKKALIMLVVLLPVLVLAWDVADYFLAEPKTEREVMGDNFLEHDRYADALDELITEHSRDMAVLDVHVDLRSAQFSLLTSAGTATVEGFGQRGGGEANVAGGRVADYERRISADERPTGTLGTLAPDAPNRIVDGLVGEGVDIDDIVSLKLVDTRWSILVATGPDANDNERWAAQADGSAVSPSGGASG